MGQKATKQKNPDEWKPVDDPCKPLGCRLQQCYEDMMRPGSIVSGEEFCKEERYDLEQCRKEHRLRSHVIPDVNPKANTSSTASKRSYTCNTNNDKQ